MRASIEKKSKWEQKPQTHRYQQESLHLPVRSCIIVPTTMPGREKETLAL